jgi:hypothetical protein
MSVRNQSRPAESWGTATGDPHIDLINAMPKHVASRSLTEVTWNARLLGPDIVGAIERLKAQPRRHRYFVTQAETHRHP